MIITVKVTSQEREIVVKDINYFMIKVGCTKL